MLEIKIVPCEDKSFKCDMNFDAPPEMDIQEQNFYIILGNGLINAAANRTQEIIDDGAKVIQGILDSQKKEVEDKTLDAAFDVVV